MIKVQTGVSTLFRKLPELLDPLDELDDPELDELDELDDPELDELDDPELDELDDPELDELDELVEPLESVDSKLSAEGLLDICTHHTSSLFPVYH
jgi:hypothetical protein